jgi:predicted ATP-dependent serine protease
MNLNLQKSNFVKVSDITIPDIFNRRMKTNVPALDEIFGEGILPGSSFTVTAKAGCGKTTLLLQLFEALALNGYNVGYASGEENQYQLAFNCKRLNIRNINIANETDIDTLCEVTKSYDALVIDSFQALTSEHKLNSRQLEALAITKLVKAAKDNECALFFIMHLTKGGILKGGTLIPHTVDVNMEIYLDEDMLDLNAKIISFSKNRFGPCMEYSALLTGTGFQFNGIKEEVKVPTKAERNQERMNQVLEMNEPPHITKDRVMEELGISPAMAYTLLKDMCDKNLIKKFGRGDEAVYKVIPKISVETLIRPARLSNMSETIVVGPIHEFKNESNEYNAA